MAITIHHNIDPGRFMWLWAKYVRSSNLEKHCTGCIPGVYSKKFSGASNPEMLSQRVLVMDEVAAGTFEAIYFCGVLKKGYLNKDPLKNNYRHNVHFAVRPVEGAHDIWEYEDWHVEIEGGSLERIPETYELGERFFHSPYDSHYYTCRIFRWMVGHFYPDELVDVTYGYPEIVHDLDCGMDVNLHELFAKVRQNGYDYAKLYFEDEELDTWYFGERAEEYRQLVPDAVGMGNIRRFAFTHKLFDRREFAEEMSEKASCGGADMMEYGHLIRFMHNEKLVRLYEVDLLWPLFEIGIEDYLDEVATYQPRRFIRVERLDSVR